MKISNKKHSLNIAFEKAPALVSDPVTTEDEPIKAQESLSDEGAAPSRARLAARIMTYAAVPLFALLFAAYAYFGKNDSPIKLIAPALSVLFASAVVLRLIPRLVLQKDDSELLKFGERSAKKLHPVVKLILLSLLLQVFVIVCVYVAHSLKYGVDSTIVNGYTNLFAHPNGIVFGENTRTAASQYGLLSFVLPEHIERMTGNAAVYIPALIMTAASIAAASVFIYELVICDHGKRCAVFSAVLLNVLPSALLLLQPFSGTSEFFALALLALLLARRRKLLFAGIAAFVASLFNLFAVLLVIPIALEFVIHRRSAAVCADPLKKIEPTLASFIIGAVLAVLPVGIAAALGALGRSGLSGFGASGNYGFDALGGLATQWGGDVLPRSVIGISIAALVALALLILFGAGYTRSSHTAFALAFTAVPAVLNAELSLYGVFVLPILASLIGSKCTLKPVRFAVFVSALLLLALLTFFLYVVRAA